MGLVNGGEADGNIPHGALLANFAEAVVSGDPLELSRLRADIVDMLGPDQFAAWVRTEHWTERAPAS